MTTSGRCSISKTTTKLVFLGVGHGGKDSGATADGFKEKDITLTMALACQDELVRHGIEIRMSRTRDEDDPLNEEVKECNAFAPDLAVDIHVNAGGGDGFEAYYTIGGGVGKVLAQNIEAEARHLPEGAEAAGEVDDPELQELTVAVQGKYGFEEKAMEYLPGYQHAKALLERLAKK